MFNATFNNISKNKNILFIDLEFGLWLILKKNYRSFACWRQVWSWVRAPWSGQIVDYKIGICCLSTEHAALRRNRKDWLVQNQENISEWSDRSTSRLLFLWARKKFNKCFGLVQIRNHNHLIECNLFSPWYGWKIANFCETTITYSHFCTV